MDGFSPTACNCFIYLYTRFAPGGILESYDRDRLPQKILVATLSGAGVLDARRRFFSSPNGFSLRVSRGVFRLPP